MKRLTTILLFTLMSLTACQASDVDLFEKVTGTKVSAEARAALVVEVDRRVASGEDVDDVEQSIASAALQKMLPKTTLRLTPAEARQHGLRIAAQRGWTESQFACIDRLWGHKESGWRWNADNPNSSAYGIPQALPGSKMGPGWRDDVDVQIRWGYNYVDSRYGGPCQALKHSDAKGWY